MDKLIYSTNFLHATSNLKSKYWIYVDGISLNLYFYFYHFPFILLAAHCFIKILVVGVCGAISSSSSSCRASGTDVSDPLSPLFPIVHRLRQVFWTTSRILTQLLNVYSCQLSCFCMAMCGGPEKYITYEFITASLAVSCMSGSSNLNSFRDRRQMAIQVVSCRVLLPGLVQTKSYIITTAKIFDNWSQKVQLLIMNYDYIIE